MWGWRHVQRRAGLGPVQRVSGTEASFQTFFNPPAGPGAPRGWLGARRGDVADLERSAPAAGRPRRNEPLPPAGPLPRRPCSAPREWRRKNHPSDASARAPRAPGGPATTTTAAASPSPPAPLLGRSVSSPPVPGRPRARRRAEGARAGRGSPAATAVGGPAPAVLTCPVRAPPRPGGQRRDPSHGPGRAAGAAARAGERRTDKGGRSGARQGPFQTRRRASRGVARGERPRPTARGTPGRGVGTHNFFPWSQGGYDPPGPSHLERRAFASPLRSCRGGGVERQTSAGGEHVLGSLTIRHGEGTPTSTPPRENERCVRKRGVKPPLGTQRRMFLQSRTEDRGTRRSPQTTTGTTRSPSP